MGRSTSNSSALRAPVDVCSWSESPHLLSLRLITGPRRRLRLSQDRTGTWNTLSASTLAQELARGRCSVNSGSFPSFSPEAGLAACSLTLPYELSGHASSSFLSWTLLTHNGPDKSSNMIYQKPLSFRPETLGDFERKQTPCASNRAPLSSSRCCSAGAGECAGHPGAGSWLCLKMFFLEAGSYVLPRRNENKAPKGSSGSLGATLRHCRVLAPCREEGRMGLCPEP